MSIAFASEHWKNASDGSNKGHVCMYKEYKYHEVAQSYFLRFTFGISRHMEVNVLSNVHKGVLGYSWEWYLDVLSLRAILQLSDDSLVSFYGEDSGNYLFSFMLAVCFKLVVL